MKAVLTTLLGCEPRTTSPKRGAVKVCRSLRLVVCSLWLVILVSNVQAQRSPFNALYVQPPDSTGYFRMLIGGHFHGESTNRSGYPASTLLAGLDTINQLGANILLSTGDLFMDPVNDRPRYERALFRKLKVPLFNAPGNHDMGGATGDELAELGRIDVGKDVILIHNSEFMNGTFSSEALDRLRAVAGAGPGEGPRNVFIVSHRPIWAEDDPAYKDLFKDNTRSVLGTNFRKDVYPLLERIAEHARVYWISGSLGGGAPSSIFFQEHAKNITFIQCAIRDEPRDALLIADVFPDSVKWSAFSLTGQTLQAPQTYDAAWWREHAGRKPGFNWRLLPYQVKTTVLRKEFWWGALVGVVILGLVRRLYRR